MENRYLIQPPTYKERILFLGENGSGKTILTRALSECLRRYVIIDQKHDFPLNQDDYVITQLKDSHLWKRSPERIVYRPVPMDATGTRLNYLLGLLYHRGVREGRTKPFAIILDECLAFSSERTTVNLTACTVSGRSIGVGLWAASQRSVGIPVVCRDQAHRIYLFNLGKRSDRKEVLEYLPDNYQLSDLEHYTQNYSFIEIKRDPNIPGSRIVRYMPPIRSI